MNSLEQRARELLAAEYQKHGHGRESAEARASYTERHECAAFDAIVAALSQQPEARVYQCPRCATSMEVDPTAKPEARGVVDDGTVLVRLHRPEGYDDVHPQLVLDDAGIHPDFRAELAALTEARNG